MLRSIIISPDPGMVSQLKAVISDLNLVTIVRVVDNYANLVQLSRAVRAHAPQLIFVSTDSLQRAISVAEQLEQILAGIQVVAVGDSSTSETLMTLMRGGIREFLPMPFNREQVKECFVRIADNLRRRPVAAKSTDLVYSFLPAKPGVGASTLAVNTSVTLGRNHPNEALLADFDLNSGVVRFLLKLNSCYTVLDAAEKAHELDENVWSQLVSKADCLDVLHSGVLNPEIRLDAMHLRQMVDYSRRNYKVISFDLSGNLEKYSLELMHESRRIFLVSTPEPCSLYLAKNKMEYLNSMDLGERVVLLLNRYHKRSTLSRSDIESLVGAPILLSIPNDYNQITRAVADGTAVSSNSEIGRRCEALAAYMVNKQDDRLPVPARRRFVEYFALSPAKFMFDNGKP